MATVGGFDRLLHFSELNQPANVGSGFLSPTARKNLARTNLGALSALAAVAVTRLTAATGSTGNTIVDGTATYSQTITNNNNKALADKINVILGLLGAP